MHAPSANSWLPAHPTLASLAAAMQKCQGCGLYKTAAQAVFGEGQRDARLVLDRALEDAGIDRKTVYVTNAVKHFKFEPRGKRRIHKKPSSVEIVACRPWLEAELGVIRPDIVVCLGATVVQSLAGRGVRVLHDRGKFELEYSLFVSDLQAARTYAARLALS